MTLVSKIERLCAGGLGILKPEGQTTGMYKRPVSGAVHVQKNGIVGDQHADTRVHGGPEKAVHHYPAEHYSKLAARFTHCADECVPGSLGENISAYDLTEKTVFIGDIYLLGTSILQVSQPRTPCWKINHRFDTEHMSLFIARERITGWYYRVIQPGLIQEGDLIHLLDRATHRFSIDEFWNIQLQHRPNIDDLLDLQATRGLNEEWKRRLAERAKWLQKQG
ncbi:MOSC domain-containing protein [Pseudomonas sp. RC10]|uniref:MOSC domain-containing protein n=1 Tax=Pseudomonas bambusae TaxID=3139142 RepID=UPI0031394190